MKLFKSIILFLAVTFTFISAGAQNVSINVLTQNSGQVNIGGSVFVEVTIANTSTTTAVPSYKLRPQISIPASIVSIPVTGHNLPAGWTITFNSGSVIRLSNATDQIPANTARTILIAVQGNILGGPQTVSGNLLFSNGVAPGSASGPATSGDNTADNVSSSTVEVVQGPACSIAVSASTGSIACNSGTTILTATATGASGAVEYSLNGGAFQIGNTFTVNATGSPYTVSAREVATPSCFATSTAVTVTEPAAISASASAVSIACNGGTTTLTVTTTGGTGTLQYSLNGGAFQAGNTFTVNAAGSPYSVTVKDANDCTVSTSAITVTEPTILTATATSTPVTTTGGSNGTATAIPAGGTPGYSYLWSPGGQTTITATGLTAGSYTVTITDQNGCTATAGTTVGSPACTISVSASAGTIACNGGTTTLAATATGASGAVEYSLNGGAFQAGNTFTVNTAGSPYTVTAREVANPTCSATSSAVIVTAPTSVSVSGSVSTPIVVSGGTGAITVIATGGTGAITYVITTGTTVNTTGVTSGIFTGLAAGSYTFTATDANGCSSISAPVVLTDPGTLPLNVTFVKNNVSVCGGVNDGSITVTATGGLAPYSYSWTGPVGFSAGNTPNLTGLSVGFYNVTVTDANLNTVVLSNIHVQNAFAVFITHSGSISGSCANTGIIVLYGNAGVQPYTFSVDGTNYQVSNTFTGLAAGVYTGYVKDAAGCISSKSNIIIGAAAPITVIPFSRPASSCANDGRIEIYRSGGIPPYSYSLDNITYQLSNTFLNQAAGVYTAWVKDSKGCTGSQTVIVAQGAALVLTAGKTNTSSCINDAVIQANASGGVAPYSFSLDGITFQASNLFTGLGAGTYTVTVKDTKACLGTVNVTIVTNPIVVTSFVTNASSCTSNNGSIQLFRTGGFGPYMYSINGNSYQAGNSFTGLSAGTYTGYVKDSRTCVGMVTVVVGPTGCAPAPIAANSKAGIPAVSEVALKIQAYPNPSAAMFTLVLEGFNSKEQVSISVSDLLGRVVYKATGTGKTLYQFGKNLVTGMYTVQVLQGNVRKSLKLVKE